MMNFSSKNKNAKPNYNSRLGFQSYLQSRIKFGKRISKELLFLLYCQVFSRELLNHLLEFGNSVLGTVFLIRKVRLFYDITGSIAQSKQDCTPRKVEKRVGSVKQIMGIPEDLLMTDKKKW